MSAVLTPTDAPATVPAGRFGGLLRAETHRFTAQRIETGRPLRCTA